MGWERRRGDAEGEEAWTRRLSQQQLARGANKVSLVTWYSPEDLLFLMPSCSTSFPSSFDDQTVMLAIPFLNAPSLEISPASFRDPEPMR